MRGITYVQAFQYWVKVFAISVPAILLLIHLGGLPARAALFGNELPRAGPSGMTITLDETERLTFPDTGSVRAVGPGELHLKPGEAVPVAEGIDAQTGEEWSRPVNETGRGSPLLVYSLLLATFLGTMGLPHILVRFYTNPDGSAARRTTVRVLGLLGAFYLFPGVYGLLGRAFTPSSTRPATPTPSSCACPPRPGRAGRRRAGGDRGRGRVRRVHVDRVGPARVDRRHRLHDVWPARRAGERRAARFRVAAVLGMIAPALLALAHARASTSPCWSAGRSRSPRARSARCCCSASGGRG
jgi:hypothetical protein